VAPIGQVVFCEKVLKAANGNSGGYHPVGGKVISGYFYSDSANFAYGSPYNPEVFVKIYIAASGWCNMAFNHVTVDPVTISSAHNYSGAADQAGSVSTVNRLLEHQYSGVGTSSISS
jgi:hypothetical protein